MRVLLLAWLSWCANGANSPDSLLRANSVLDRVDALLDKEIDMLSRADKGEHDIAGRDTDTPTLPQRFPESQTLLPDPEATKLFSDNPLIYVGTNIVNSLSILTSPANGDNKALQELLATNPAEVQYVITRDDQHYLEIATEAMDGTQTANWLGYLNSAAQDSLDKVPSILLPVTGPPAGASSIVLTGALNGCSIIATKDAQNPGFVRFYHDSAPKKNLVDGEILARLDYDKDTGGSFGQQYYATAPDGKPLCDIGANPPEVSNALVLIAFAQGKWNIVAQPQCIVGNGMSTQGLKVVRKTGSVLTIPVSL